MANKTLGAHGFLPLLNGALGQYNAGQQGVFALHPLATPKYAKNNGLLRSGEFQDTLARIYISLADESPEMQSAYLTSLPGDAATQALAQVLLGANSHGGSGFIDFFLTSVNEPFQEMTQIDKVMADDYVAFFFGQQPPVFQYSGTLLNSMQDDQRGGFARAYQQMLRGTQLARRGALARLRYDSVIVSGTMVGHQQQMNADNEMAVPFSFSFLVKEYVVLTNLPYAKLSSSDYVKLAADAALVNLQPIGIVNDTRVRTTAVTTTQPAEVSTAGAEKNTMMYGYDASYINANVMEQTFMDGLAATPTTPVTNNTYGVIDTNPLSLPDPMVRFAQSLQEILPL